MLVVAGCAASPSSSRPSVSAVPATATPPPTATPVPVIAAGTDATFAKLAEGEAPEVTLIATGDTFVIGGNTMGSPPRDFFAYDPATGVMHALPSPGRGTFFPDRSAGNLVVGALTRVTRSSPTMGVRGVVIENVVTGQVRVVWPSRGYDALAVDGLAEGYAFGEMAKYQPFGDGATYRESRAFMIDLATGVLTDLTPPDVPSPALVQVRGLADGRALVAILPGDVAGERRISQLVLVDIATGVRSTPALDVGRLSTISEVWEPDEFRLDGDLIVGEIPEVSDGPSRPFVYHLTTGAFDVVPLQGSMLHGACRFRLDATRLVCYGTASSTGPVAETDGEVFLYDTEHRTTTTIPTPGLTGSMWPRALADGRIVLTDDAAGLHAPLVYVVATGATYRLGMPQGSGPAPLDVAIVGDLIVGSSWWVFDPRVWRLP
jgi:hypothetical protein